MEERVKKNLIAFLTYGDGINWAIKEHDLKPKLEDFTGYYNIYKIKDLDYASYCAGHDNKNSFCYYIQNGQYISQYGGLQHFHEWYFNVFLDDDGKPYAYDRNTLSKITDENEVEKIFLETKNAIIDTINGARNNDNSLIENASKVLEKEFQSKIVYLYSPDNHIPYFDNASIGEVLMRLGVDYEDDIGLLEKQQKLYEYYTSEFLPLYKNVTPFMFARFLLDDLHGYHYF